MQTYIRAIALIRRLDESGKSQWLLRWGEREKQFSFLAGNRLEREAFRETIMREVAWEFGLSADRDFLVASAAQFNLEYVGRLPACQADYHVAVAFYLVDLFKKATKRKLDRHEHFRWLSSPEIVQGFTSDGLDIDQTQVYLINRTQVIYAWS